MNQAVENAWFASMQELVPLHFQALLLDPTDFASFLELLHPNSARGMPACTHASHTGTVKR
jgi:hypothetical protein